MIFFHPTNKITISFNHGELSTIQVGAIPPKVFWRKNFGDISTFGDFRRDSNKFFVRKMKKRLGVRNDVIFKHFCQSLKVFHNRFECSESPKCVELVTSSNAIK
jgi:hypothetical protein